MFDLALELEVGVRAQAGVLAAHGLTLGAPSRWRPVFARSPRRLSTFRKPSLFDTNRDYFAATTRLTASTTADGVRPYFS